MGNGKRLIIDMMGKTFNRLYVRKFIGIKDNRYLWECKCTCGKVVIVDGYSIRKGHTKSCGCYANEIRGKSSITHHLSETNEYAIWTDIKTRCFNKRCRAYPNYGGRGITLCNRWLNFTNFLQDLGTRPSKQHTVERLDNDGNYEPTNCKWILKRDQVWNQRRSKRLTYDGVTLCAGQWANKLGWPHYIITNRLRYGWSLERTLTEPIRIDKRSPSRISRLTNNTATIKIEAKG